MYFQADLVTLWSVRTSFGNVLKKAKIKDLILHSLRHTFGTRLGMAGVDVKTINNSGVDGALEH